MNRDRILAVAVVAVLYLAYEYREGVEYSTAGDDGSNIFEDGLEDMKARFGIWPAGSIQYRAHIEVAAERHGVPVEILVYLLWQESRYRPDIIDGRVRSSVGALGIAQFMPATAMDEMGSVQAALDPFMAIPAAARYLAKIYRAAGGGWREALAAYNWGIGNVRRKGLSLAPAETRNYYTSILSKASAMAGTEFV